MNKETVVLAELYGACIWCGENNFETFTIEHIMASSRGGSSTLANKAIACKSCNNRRGSKSAADYFKAICRKRGYQNSKRIFLALNTLLQNGNKKEKVYARRQLKILSAWQAQYSKWKIL